MQINKKQSYSQTKNNVDSFNNVKNTVIAQQINNTQLCVHQMFEAQVEKSPDAVAVVCLDENEFAERATQTIVADKPSELTYRHLNQRANQLAHHLRTLGVGSEVLVGIYMERSLEMIVAILGVLKAGGAYVPLDPAYPPERLAFILEDTKTPVMLTQEKLLGKLPTHGTQVVCVDSEWKEISRNSQENPVNWTTPENLIYVIYTSGSTGQPKGVMISHCGICNQLHWRQTTFKLTDTDKVLQTISFSFDPSVWQIFWPLCFGAQLILPRLGGHQDSAYLVKTIVEQQITVLAMVPSMLRVLLEEKGIENCQNLKHITCGGEALTVELLERFFVRLNLDNVLHNCYGPTEASIDASFWTCQRQTNYVTTPIGRPIANAEIYILDSDLQPIPVGELGELHIGGIGLARGYLNRPELTAQKFIPHPFNSSERLYKTGDLARYLSDGNIEFLGRLDQQVKIRGFRIELGEIEAKLLLHPSVQTSIVIAHEDKLDNKRLVAYVVPKTGQTLTTSELRDFLKQRLADYMIPSAFFMLKSLPLTPNGKVDRRALPTPGQNRPELAIDFIAPTDEVELKLTQIWQEALGINFIGVKDNFFDLGGHSLVALRLLSLIEQTFGKSLPLSTFLQAPTVEQVAKILQQEESPTLWKPLIPIQPNGKKPPLFCIHAADGNVMVFHNLVANLDADQPVYALQPHGLDGKKPFHTKIEDMASDYVREIRTIQPQGPYLLAGYSAGGVIAFEMAQQLVAQGEKVELLGLFDTYSSAYFHESLSQWIFRHWRNFLGLKSQHKLKYLLIGIQEFFLNIKRDSNIDNAENVSLEYNRSPMEMSLFATQEQAVKDYCPQVYSGKITLFRSSEQPLWLAGDRKLGWQGLAEVEVHDIPGNHNNILRANVKFLGDKLRDCLKITNIEQ
ncbi:amino acid adenylation domain-containing protein [Nostoc sp. NIES-3756]|uniref:non-ribosomal peptide synthetase n=1 Tax=Nostoc sp. NIES-3756 TaxID=1751286 RepID=UPI0007202E3C|nr:amino acid adenylation domain-containing protein [Nostoc sp. NIES-3756]BAT54991.1 amino acid adenylation domain-containing protein [Nostoc sp. NIES-3756]